MQSKTLNNKRLICITGMDGVGKSTLVESLAKSIPHACVANIWDLLASPIASLPFQNKRQIDDFLCALTPNSRLLFLAHALQYSIDKALEGEDEIILINSYYYKYFATELALGANFDLVHALTQNFPQPDMTVKLTLSVDEAANRKDILSRYECGLVKKPTAETFISHQQKTAEHWPSFEKGSWAYLDARQSPEQLFLKAKDLIASI